ncbi:hypothetical protein [Mesorhizobium silamurunense]|uniref:hypothetical protein n=1 Tax=Mesorhizobium silamurunense TaxID=499528 RepID=UPI001FE6799C|nr:hypothetical protein [Mesorhizobium silamurunense]
MSSVIAFGKRLACVGAGFAAAGLSVFAVAALAAGLGLVFFGAAAAFGLEVAFAGEDVLAGEAVLECEALGAPALPVAALAFAFAGGVVFAAFATKSLPGVPGSAASRRARFRYRKRPPLSPIADSQEIRHDAYVLPLSAAVQVLPQRQRRKDLPPKSLRRPLPEARADKDQDRKQGAPRPDFGRRPINKKMRSLTMS